MSTLTITEELVAEEIGADSALLELDATIVAQARQFSYKHAFGKDWCLRNLDFAIGAGETVAILGESGSGKTTLIDCLTGFSPHFYRGGTVEGDISFLGEEIADCDILKLARRYGRVSQDPRTQLFAQQVEDAIAFPMENQGQDRATMEQRMTDALRSLHIEHIRDRDATTLSGGEGQAVVIASMLVKDPEVMFFDDITSALDPRGQTLVKNIIESLGGQDRTIFVVDPDFDWLATVADRVLLLDAGELVFNGPPEALMRSHDLMARAGILRPEISTRPLTADAEAIRVDDLHYDYDGHVAVDGVSLSIKHNAVTGIVGHNGSGKSTMAKLLAGLLEPGRGTIDIGGRRATGLPAPEMVKLVGYLYQQPSRMFFNQTVAEELDFTPKALGTTNCVTLDAMKLADVSDAPPHDLSAGQQQRLALGCVLSCDPEIIILDEPTQGLNQQGRVELVALIERLQAEGKTIVLISHDMYLVANATQDLIVMDHGKLIRQEATEDLLAEPRFFRELGLQLPWEEIDSYDV